MEFLDTTYYARGEPLTVIADNAGSPFLLRCSFHIGCLQLFEHNPSPHNLFRGIHHHHHSALTVSVGLAVLLLTIVVQNL